MNVDSVSEELILCAIYFSVEVVDLPDVLTVSSLLDVQTLARVSRVDKQKSRILRPCLLNVDCSRGLALCSLGDNFLRDGVRTLLVVIELHGVGCTALSVGAEVGGVTEHL